MHHSLIYRGQNIHGLTPRHVIGTQVRIENAASCQQISHPNANKRQLAVITQSYTIMSSVQTSTRFGSAREVRTRATGTIKDINEGADFARKVIEMLGIVVELLNKIAIFPTKLTTQKKEFVNFQC